MVTRITRNIKCSTGKKLEDHLFLSNHFIVKKAWDFPGDPVVKNLPCSVGDIGLIPSWGTEIPHVTRQLILWAIATEHVYFKDGSCMTQQRHHTPQL